MTTTEASPGYQLSVDLGTTFSAAAVSQGGEPEMVGLGNRALEVPSVLFSTDAGFVVGEAAERRGAAESRRLVREFKRRLGDPVPVLVDGVPYPAEALSATLLRWVVDAVTRRQGGPPDELVLTHPASWGAYKLEVLREVVRLAELPPARWCAEPVAAAGQYASRSRVEEGARLGVYDLGGGTFDACVLQKAVDGFVVLGPAEGVEHLGGVDFDEAVFEQVRGELGGRLDRLDVDDPETVAGLARLRRECVAAKEALSTDSEASVDVTLPGLLTSVRVTRSDLERLIRPSLEQTADAMARAVRAAGLTPTDLDGLVLVGGSSRIPLVAEVLERRLGLRTALDTHPKHDVALGALRTRTEAAPTRAGGSVAAVRTPVSADVAEDATAGSVAASTEDGRRRRPLVVGAVVAAVVIAAVLLLVFAVPGRRDGNALPAAVPPPASSSTFASPAGPAGLPALPASAPLDGDQLVVTMQTDGHWDLYLASVDDDRPTRRLTSSPADEFTPVLSPDRRTIVYQYDTDLSDQVRTLHVMAADGTGDRPLFATVPSFCAGVMYRPGWDPVDPTVLALPCTDSTGHFGLYLVRTDGSLVQAVPFDGDRADDPTFASDGRLVFWAGPLTGDQLAHPALADGLLWLREVDGTVRRLPGVGTARDADPQFSPDGSRIAFRRRQPNGTTDGNLDVYVLDLGSGRLTKVVGTPYDEEDPSWSPDGRRLAFKSNEPTKAWPGTPVTRTWVVDADGTDRRVLLTADARGKQTAPAWTRR